VHDASAGLLFVVFMIFAGALFTRSHASDIKAPLTARTIVAALFQTILMLRPYSKDAEVLPPQKERRNKIYRTCGRLIALSILMVLVEGLVERLHFIAEAPFPQWTFAWEVVAVWAFAFSWLTKAESFSFVKDQPGADSAVTLVELPTTRVEKETSSPRQ
jgi:hypothetical protein